MFCFRILPILCGKCGEFDILKQTWQCNIKHNKLWEKTAVVLPFSCPFSVGVIAARELLVEKPKSLLLPWAGGVVTNDWYINSLPASVIC